MNCQAVDEVPTRDSSAEDVSLVDAARQGDRTAFGWLYERYARMVHGILLSRVPPSEVDDLVQDVFLLALPRLPTLRDPARFGAWLAAIARNRAHDYHRQSIAARQSAAGLAEGVSEARSSPGAEEAEAAAVLAVIQSLPERYRETLVLRLVEGMTGPEIAARTGLTAGSVRVNLHRGMQKLRGQLDQKAVSGKPKEGMTP